MLVKRPCVVALEERLVRLPELSQERKRCSGELEREVLVVGLQEVSKGKRFLTPQSVHIG